MFHLVRGGGGGGLCCISLEAYQTSQPSLFMAPSALQERDVSLAKLVGPRRTVITHD